MLMRLNKCRLLTAILTKGDLRRLPSCRRHFVTTAFCLTAVCRRYIAQCVLCIFAKGYKKIQRARNFQGPRDAVGSSVRHSQHGFRAVAVGFLANGGGARGRNDKRLEVEHRGGAAAGRGGLQRILYPRGKASAWNKGPHNMHQVGRFFFLKKEPTLDAV